MLINLKNYKFLYSKNRYIQTMTDTLVLLHVIFRHGDRTPDKEAIYPKDPHKGCDYSPYGYGQLTNDGKRRAYRFGQSLRERYGNFLEDFYKPDRVDAWSSDFDRTKMTLLLVLASLFPPKNEQVWHDNILWQPIPYKYVPKRDDKIFLAFVFNKWAVDEYNNHVNGPGRKVMDAYSDVIKYVEQHSGKEIKNPRGMLSIACTLATQESLGLKLPTWTNKVWPHEIEEIAMQEFEFTSATTKLKSLIIGKLMEKIINDSLLKVKGLSATKIHLYSGHDFTVGIFLKALDLFDWQHPDFCSNIVLELHNIGGIYGFKIKYQCRESDEVRLLEVPNVGSFWPIENFIEQHKAILEYKSYDINN